MLTLRRTGRRERFCHVSLVPFLGVVLALLLIAMANPPDVRLLDLRIARQITDCGPIVASESIHIIGHGSGDFTVAGATQTRFVTRDDLETSLARLLRSKLAERTNLFLEFEGDILYSDVVFAMDVAKKFEGTRSIEVTDGLGRTVTVSSEISQQLVLSDEPL